MFRLTSSLPSPRKVPLLSLGTHSSASSCGPQRQDERHAPKLAGEAVEAERAFHVPSGDAGVHVAVLKLLGQQPRSDAFSTSETQSSVSICRSLSCSHFSDSIVDVLDCKHSKDTFAVL